MEIALFLVALVVVVLAGAALADRLTVPAPLLLIAVGVVGTYLPFVPEVHLEPEIVLLGLLLTMNTIAVYLRNRSARI